MEMTHWIGPLFVLWALACGLVLLRRSIPGVWRLSSLLVLIFYGAWYSPELLGPIATEWTQRPFQQVVLFLVALIRIVPLLLIFAWPLILFQASRERTAEAAGHHLRTLTVLTLFYWVFWLGAYVSGVDLSAPGLQSALENLLQIPGGAEMKFSDFQFPDLPEPPAGP